ncbi:hypothetical protein C8Q77DRAFT_1162387 [Trametes polyzona]|nr:hypothetical protein C8Q77DRAFT_1162387 [Trametes polyzona]
MSDYDAGAYKDTPHNSFYPDSSSQGRSPSGYPPSSGGRRPPRYSRPPNTSWVSNSNGNGMFSPPPFAGPPSTPGSRPLPVPSPAPSRAAQDFRPQYPSPSELGEEPPPSSYRRSAVADPAEPEEWEPETERMTIDPSLDEEHHYGSYQDAQHHLEGAPEYESQGHGQRGGDQYNRYEQQAGQSQPPQESFYDPISMAIAEELPRPKKKTFVGGFVASLRKLPQAVVKSHFYDRKSTRRGAPGTEQPTGPSHYLPAYDDPGVTVPHPESMHYVEAVGMPTSPRSLSQVSHPDLTRPSSGVRSQRYSGQSVPHSANRAASPRIRTMPEVTPVVVSPHPASDYAKMDSPVRFAPPDDSFSAHVTRVKDFLHDLKALPWTSSRVALDYIPAQSSRARVGKAKEVRSWYTGVQAHQEIDLLGSARPAPRRLRSEDGGSARVVIAHDGRTPASYLTSPGLMPSPALAPQPPGQHMAVSYYISPPQPLVLYTPQMAAPPATQPYSGSHQPPDPATSQQGQEPAGQAIPVLMMSRPPPNVIPTPPPVVHAPGHPQSARSSPNPPPPGLPVSQSHSHHSHSITQ